jgi:CBS domain-containing protein
MAHGEHARRGEHEPAVKRMQVKVGDVMTRDLVTVGPDASFTEIVDVLLDRDVSGVPVVDRDRNLLGIITEADLISKEAYPSRRRRHLSLVRDHLAGRKPDWVRKSTARRATQLMSTDVLYVSPDDDLTTAARLMLERGVKRLPVCENGRLVGIVSRSDLLAPFRRSDDELAMEVKEMLADPLRAPEHHQVSFEVHSGVVSLHGATRFPSDIRVLVAFVSGIPGVVGVDHDLVAVEAEPSVERVLPQS